MLKYILHAFVVILILWITNKYFKGHHFNSRYFLLGIGYKILMTLVLCSLFQFHYQGGDPISIFTTTTRYLENGWFHFLGTTIPEWIKQPRTAFFSKLISPFIYISGNFWITSLYLSVAGFLGTWYFLNVLSQKFPQSKWLFYFALILLPSAVFWSSGILKETLANAFMYVVMGVFLSWFWRYRLSWIEYSLAVIFLVSLTLLRFYLGGIMFIFILILSVDRLVPSSRLQWGKIMSALILVLGFFGMQFLHPWMTWERLPLTIFENHQMILAQSRPESVMIYQLEPTYLSLFLNFPIAIFNALFRPMIWELPSWISWPEKFENAMLLILTIGSLAFVRSWKLSFLGACTLLFIMIMLGFLALSSPNFGSLARYISGILPLFFIMIFWYPWRKIFLKD